MKVHFSSKKGGLRGRPLPPSLPVAMFDGERDAHATKCHKVSDYSSVCQNKSRGSENIRTRM